MGRDLALPTASFRIACVSLLTVCWLVACTSGSAAEVNPLIRSAPGYFPPDDPESKSVVLGRRENAPLVKMRFTGGTSSLEALGRAVCRALSEAERNALGGLCITREEFAGILWREFPQSRPVTGLTADDGWFLLERRNWGGIARAMGESGGRSLRFVRWERGAAPTRYKNFKLHNDLVLVVEDEGGSEQRLDVVRTVAERKGAFKLYSLKD
jgi:hypothetical protein